MLCLTSVHLEAFYEKEAAQFFSLLLRSRNFFLSGVPDFTSKTSTARSVGKEMTVAMSHNETAVLFDKNPSFSFFFQGGHVESVVRELLHNLPKTIEFSLRSFECSSRDHQSSDQRHLVYFFEADVRTFKIRITA